MVVACGGEGYRQMWIKGYEEDFYVSEPCDYYLFLKSSIKAAGCCEEKWPAAGQGWKQEMRKLMALPGLEMMVTQEEGCVRGNMNQG